MSEVTINRRQAVRAAAGVAAGGLLVTGLGVSSATASNSSDLLGSWLVKHQATDPASDEVGTTVVSFIADGVIVTNDIKPPGTISTGSWEWTSSDKFQATFWSGVNESGSEHTGRIKVTGKLSDGKIKGTYTFTLYDMDDKVVFTEKGDFWGEPLDA